MVEKGETCRITIVLKLAIAISGMRHINAILGWSGWCEGTVKQ